MLSLENPNSPLQQICCHSHRGNKANLLGIGAGLSQAGHNALLFAPTPGSWQPLPVRAAVRVELIDFEGADHCGGYFLERPGYIAKVTDFLKRHYSINAKPVQPPS